MAIVVEDGSIVTGANSYITEAELTAYATARGVTLTGNTEQLLIESMDYIESQNFKGIKSTEGQPLQWPRYDVVVDGYLISNDEIPQLLKDAEAETAMAIDIDNNPLDDIARVTLKETVGPISVEYSDNGQADTINLVGSSSGGSSFVVSRG